MTKNSIDAAKVDPLILSYLEGNEKKNEGATAERKSKKALEIAFANHEGVYTLKVSDKLSLVAGFQETDGEEIDARKLFEAHPDKFWDIISVPKTTAIDVLGEKAAAKITRTVKKTVFNVKKVKQ